MSEFEVYVWLMLDSISNWFVWMCLIGTLIVSGFGVSGLYHLMYGSEFNDEESLNKSKASFGVVKKLACWLAILTLGGVFTPSSKQYAVIKVLPAVVNSDFAKEASGDSKMIYDMARDYLKNMLKVEAPDAKA